MIANRMRPIGLVAAVCAAALGCYLVSVRVASERTALERTERQIATVERDIRRLQTELATRGSMQQLERWNRDVLALAAPGVGQYLQTSHQLAAYALDGGPAAPAGEARVMQASAAATAPQAEVARLIPAVVTDPAPVRPRLIPASHVVEGPAPTPAATLRTAAYQPPLLAQSTLDDLTREARAEARDR